MEAMACHWAASHTSGMRTVRKADVERILASGDRAFNLRVADPYLPYQRQGLGFTWSFFTPKDTQDVHVHGMPAVEIYGVIEGRLLIWHKPMNQRGARTWQHTILEPGDWAEMEPLECHFACWLTPHGLGTVIKASAQGELGGHGRIGEKGKTTCKDCSMNGACLFHPGMTELMSQYSQPYGKRDYVRIGSAGDLFAKEE